MSKRAKKSSSSAGKQLPTFESLQTQLRELTSLVIGIGDATQRLQAHVEELDMKVIYTMNAIAISKVKHGGVLGLGGQPEKTTKKLMQWYRDGGRDQLIMQLQQVEDDIKKAQAAAGEIGEEIAGEVKADDDTTTH